MNIRGLFLLCLATFVAADLRMASQPKVGYRLVNQGTTPWKIMPWTGQYHYRYMEPSTFGYAGLENQKKKNYDNFLRSNVDNEQDNRNFENEDGKDHLPFRTMEGDVDGKYTWYVGGTNRRRSNIMQAPEVQDLTKSMKAGDSMMVPLRWNNPHAAEMEVNIWIHEHTGDRKQPIVVPIRKPSCSAEGHQDNIISFTVPADFADLGAKIPGFKGCTANSSPMCTLQIYSHSVESRTYAIGFPIFIAGHNDSLSTTNSSGIREQSPDHGLDLSGLRDICLPATDPSATIATAVPRWARLISDVYNHAYQNSDYSPYSGQQPEGISKNLQASAINKMEVGNRGELGKSILPSDTHKRLRHLQKLESKIYKNYEALANKIIKSLGNNMTSTGKIGDQQLATCFRCAETGSTNTKRQETNTYIPSFQLPKNLIPAARKLVPDQYSNLITESGIVQIYVASLNDLMPFYYESRHLGLTYQTAIVKHTLTTMTDDQNFKKRNKEGKVDKGEYASVLAKQKFVAAHGCPAKCLYVRTEPDGAKSSLLHVEEAPAEDLPYKLVLKGHECKSKEVYLGKPDTLKECADAVKAAGGTYFIYGTGRKAKKCYKENTASVLCMEGFERDHYDFYTLDVTPKQDHSGIGYCDAPNADSGNKDNPSCVAAGSFEDAVSKCNADKECLYLVDGTADGTNWLTCSSIITPGDGKAVAMKKCGAKKFELVGWNMQCKDWRKDRITVYHDRKIASTPSKCYDAVVNDPRCGHKQFFEVGSAYCACYRKGCELSPDRHEDLYRIEAYGPKGKQQRNGAPGGMDCNETYAGDKGKYYMGCQTKTRSGKTCQRWVAQSPHKHGYGRIGDHNYCRNPSGSDSIWCYTTDSKSRWDYCNPIVADINNPTGKWAPAPGGRLGGKWISGEHTPTIKFDLGDNVWILGVKRPPYLKMIQIRITGQRSYETLQTAYQTDGKYDKKCDSQETFYLECFGGRFTTNGKYIYSGHFVPNIAPPQLAPVTDAWYCVANVNKNRVNGPFADLASAKEELNKSPGSRSNRQMICQMSKDGPKKNALWVGNENQGAKVAAGFNSYWHGTSDITRMNGMCNSNHQLHCKLNVPRNTIAKPLLKGSYGTNVTADCEPCVQFFGKTLKKPDVTKIAKIVMHGHNPNKVKQLNANPDNTWPGTHTDPGLLAVASATSANRRRRRRAAF
jgi:hypothetical protein